MLLQLISLCLPRGVVMSYSELGGDHVIASWGGVATSWGRGIPTSGGA